MDTNTIITIIGGILTMVIVGVWNSLRKTTKKQVQDVSDTVDNLNERIDQIVKERDTANERVGQLKLEVDDLQAKVKNLETLNSETKTKAEAIAKERDEEAKKNARLLEEIASANKGLADQEREMRTLEGRIRDLEQQIAVSKSLDAIVASLGDKLTTAIHAATQPIAPVVTGVNPT